MSSMVINLTVKHSNIETIERSYRFFDGKFAGYYFILINFIISSFIVNMIYEYDFANKLLNFIGPSSWVSTLIIFVILLLAIFRNTQGYMKDGIKRIASLTAIHLLFSIYAVVSLVILYIFNSESLTYFLVLSYTIIFIFSLIYGSSYLYVLFTKKNHNLPIRIELKNKDIIVCELLSITKFGDLVVNDNNDKELWINRNEICNLTIDK